MLAGLALLPACAPAPLMMGASLSSYKELANSDGKITRSRLHARKETLAQAKTVRILPTAFPSAVSPTLSDEQRALVANTVSRALCVSLSDRFDVVPSDAPADLTVRANVTQVTETNEVSAAISTAAWIGMKFVDMGGIPVPIPRVPIGLGDLSVEAEAVDRSGKQQAAMIWGRGATAFFSTPRVSKASDAYDLGDKFGEDFASLLINGESPFATSGIDLPSMQKIGSNLGFAPKHAACEVYGRSPGLIGLVAGRAGLPPEWTDGAPAGAAPAAVAMPDPAPAPHRSRKRRRS